MKKEIFNNAELYLGDCRDILPTIKNVDVIICDPPYGNGTEYGIFKDTKDEVLKVINFVIPWGQENTKRMLITTGTRYYSFYPNPDWTLVWVTPAGSGCGPWGFCCWQPILAYGKDPYLASGQGSYSDVFIHTESSQKNGHPCPKPIKFMQKLIDRGSLEGETILDPFMGSGTTGVAALSFRRKFVGIEIEPKYFDIACKRIEEESKQINIFDNPKKKFKPTVDLFKGA